MFKTWKDEEERKVEAEFLIQYQSCGGSGRIRTLDNVHHKLQVQNIEVVTFNYSFLFYAPQILWVGDGSLSDVCTAGCIF